MRAPSSKVAKRLATANPPSPLPAMTLWALVAKRAVAGVAALPSKGAAAAACSQSRRWRSGVERRCA